MIAAARASLRLLAEDPVLPPRRVVLAAEISDGLVSYEPGDAALNAKWERALVQLHNPLPGQKIASGAVDDLIAGPAIRAALVALVAPDAGDEDASVTV